MTFFCIPSDFKITTLEKIDELNKSTKKYKVYETYGQATGTIFPSGRGNAPHIDFKELKKYVFSSHKYGIRFNYVLNGFSFNNLEFDLEGIRKIRSFLRQLKEIEIDSITLTLPALVEIIQEDNLGFDIVVSTINQINDIETARIYNNGNIKRIVLGESINRNIPIINKIYKNVGCDLEIISNSVCFIKCPWRSFHYNQIAQSSIINDNHGIASCYYTNKCLLRRLENPANYLKLAFIRPEDMKYYTSAGVKFFKIQGRQYINNANIIKTLQAYFTEDFDGNIMSLLNCFAGKSNEIYIDNKKLSGFIDPFLKFDICQNGCAECNHCQKFIDKSCKTNFSKIEMIKDYIIANNPYNRMLKQTE